MLSGNPSIYIINSTDGGNTGSGIVGTLPYVIGQANRDPNTAGSVIEFDPTVFDPHTSHTIDLQGTLDLHETAGPEAIEGPGASVATVSGGEHFQVFLVSKGATAKLSNLTIADGKGAPGGGIDNNGKLSVATCTFASNSTDDNGGGISVFGGQLTLIDRTVADNSAPNGAGIAVNARFTAINDTIADNTSPGGIGGGLFVDKSTNFLYNTIAAQNTLGTGGATASDIVVSNGGSVTGSYNLIGKGGSGGLINQSQSLTKANVTISSAIGFNYGPTSVTGSGAMYTITLGRPIKQPDIVTFVISGSGITTFTGALPVLRRRLRV